LYAGLWCASMVKCISALTNQSWRVLSVDMEHLNPEKLHVIYLTGTEPGDITIPRRYTLTHSDITGELFLTIGSEYDTKQISGLYTRFMRDEVLAELCGEGDSRLFRVYCHVSGGLLFGTASWRYNIFKSELPLVLEAIRYGDRSIFEQEPELDSVPVFIHFNSKDSRFNKVEEWGTMFEYK